MKKTSFILVIVILAMILAGCQPANVPSADTTVGDTTAAEAADTTAFDSLVRIVADGKSDYMVLRADLAPDTEVDAAVALRNAIDEAYGVRMRIGNEIDAQPERAIIVGNVNYGGAAELPPLWAIMTTSLRFRDSISSFAAAVPRQLGQQSTPLWINI